MKAATLGGNMNEDDQELLGEIRDIADRANENRDKMIDIVAAATTLSAKYEHRPYEEILERLKLAFRNRELFWLT
jgi:hypothetical protein